MHITDTIEIRRPPAEVFGFVANVANYPDWMAHVLEVQQDAAGSPQRGDRFSVVIKSVGRRFETHYVRTAYEADRRTTDAAVSGPVSDQQWHSVFEEAPGGTRLIRSVDVSSRGLLKLLEPLQRVAAGRQLGKDLRTLKAILEAR